MIRLRVEVDASAAGLNLADPVAVELVAAVKLAAQEAARVEVNDFVAGLAGEPRQGTG